MNWREWFKYSSASVGAAGLPLMAAAEQGLFHAGAPAGGSRRAAPAAAAHHRCPDHPDAARRYSPGRRQGDDQRAGAVRPGLRHLHPAGPRRRDGHRQVPQAVPDRQGPAADRGHLAVVVRQLLLAQRPGAGQRPQRRGHGPVGHPRQARRPAGLPALRRQVPRGASIPTATPAARRFKEVEEAACRAAGRGYRHIRAQVAVPGLSTYGVGGGAASDNTHARQSTDAAPGSRRRTSASCRSCSSTCASKSATRSSCCTTCTSACRRSWPCSSPAIWSRTSLFFLEDPFSPEDVGYFDKLRQQTTTPHRDGRAVQQPQRVCAAD